MPDLGHHRRSWSWTTTETSLRRCITRQPWKIPLQMVSLVMVVVGMFLEPETKIKIKIEGDIMLGGLFPMHEAGNPPNICGAFKEEKGMQRAEAMLYALDEINADPELLPNVSLGAIVLDTCSRETFALEQAMEFVKSSLNEDLSEFRCEDGKRPELPRRIPVAGVIGASSSTESIMVANILRLFRIPQISYSATSTELSDKARFGFFSRVVPPDDIQARAMVDIVRELGWRWVSTVAVEGEYGEKGIASFTELAEKADVCIAVSEKIARNARERDYDRIIRHLYSKSKARAVAMFVDEDNCRKLLNASMRANTTGHFLWIGSDSWGAKIHPVRNQEKAAEGAITILPQKTSIIGFDDYFQTLNPSNNERNVWYTEFWENHFRCIYYKTDEDEEAETNDKKRQCPENVTLINYEQEGLVPFVVDAVYAMAHALHNLISDKCGTDPFHLCDKMLPAPNGQELLAYIRNVSFIGRQNQEVKFNRKGDAYGSYDIFQYQKLIGKYDYVRVGNWSEGLYLDLHRMRWTESTFIPFSACSDECPKSHHRSFQGSQCCWKCVPCREDEFPFNDTCVPCPQGYFPKRSKIGCRRLPVEFMTWYSPWAIVPIGFAFLGVVFTLFTATVFVRYNATPVIMASGRELCYVMLIGILLCYLNSFVILAKPTIVSCSLMRLSLGLCLCVCYSAIFTKTNRISRIFNRGMKTIKRPRYTSPRSQIFICMCLVSVQMTGSIAWLVMEAPRTKESYPNRFTVVLQCGISHVSLIVSLAYNMLLIVLCTIYAFKTRKIPENFNEAKYIGFSMYSTCIVWLAFIPIYFGTNNDYRIQIASMCMCLSISASVALGCLFTPKLYIVLCQPYKNVRQGGSQSSGGAGQAAAAAAARVGGHRPVFGQSMKFNSRESSHVEIRQSRTTARPTQSNGDLQATSTSIGESSMSDCSYR